ncbi:MAG: thioredoxin family protein [Candidatus Krumholzibacteriota bacterium]|nr:thioredoxin family protein [Candidatus Krumholzibacteriota bacterium]
MTGMSVRRMAAVLVSAAGLLLALGCGGGAREEAPADGIGWLADVDSALTLAKTLGAPVMIDFMAVWCPPCRRMEDTTFCDPAVVAKARSFVTVRIDVDEQRDVAVRYGGNARKYGGVGIPNILFLGPSGETVKHVVGFQGPAELVAAMDSVLTLAGAAR